MAVFEMPFPGDTLMSRTPLISSTACANLGLFLCLLAFR
jgi:hypothetical protein